MDEATFLKLLAKYPTVRSKNAVLRPPHRRSMLGGAPAPAPAALPSPPPPPAAAPPADFWAGLNAFLVERCGAASAKAIAASFDTLHCACFVCVCAQTIFFFFN